MIDERKFMAERELKRFYSRKIEDLCTSEQLRNIYIRLARKDRKRITPKSLIKYLWQKYFQRR